MMVNYSYILELCQKYPNFYSNIPFAIAIDRLHFPLVINWKNKHTLFQLFIQARIILMGKLAKKLEQDYYISFY